MKILIAEDDSVSRRILEAHLAKWGYKVVAVADGAEAWDVLQRLDAPRIAVLDWVMPQIDGPELCRRIRAATDRPFTYIIILTAKERTSDIVEALDAGADDYLTKPYHAEELRSRIGAATRIVHLHEQLEEANAKLFMMARTDGLTRIYNRAAIVERLEQEIARSQRDETPFAALMLDVDHFKRVNDKHGHLIGDKVLVEIAQRLCAECRPYDSTGRFGGEEFLVVLPGPRFEDMSSLADRIRQRVKGTPIAADGQRLEVTVSTGAVWVDAGKKLGVQEVIKAADDLLYKAKENGRDRVEAARWTGT
ncbi:MAG: diguanylate cyclase [Candidatus Hydrogenedentes bacterium]|nr:diguanylate cyclase [Candidatus Hydrogenedentota bacterium]